MDVQHAVEQFNAKIDKRFDDLNRKFDSLNTKVWSILAILVVAAAVAYAAYGNLSAELGNLSAELGNLSAELGNLSAAHGNLSAELDDVKHFGPRRVELLMRCSIGAFGDNRRLTISYVQVNEHTGLATAGHNVASLKRLNFANGVDCQPNGELKRVLSQATWTEHVTLDLAVAALSHEQDNQLRLLGFTPCDATKSEYKLGEEIVGYSSNQAVRVLSGRLVGLVESRFDYLDAKLNPNDLIISGDVYHGFSGASVTCSSKFLGISIAEVPVHILQSQNDGDNHLLGIVVPASEVARAISALFKSSEPSLWWAHA